MCKYLILGIFFLFLSSIKSQTPFYTNYTTEEYNGSTQNWAMIQDKQGILYFGNNDGVLEYDGSTWRLIKTKTTVRSLAITEDQKIYVGMVNDFGILEPDSLGYLHFNSIKDQYPDQDLECKDVWRTQVLNGEVFFCSFEKIIRLKENKIKVFLPEENYTYSFKINSDLYVHAVGRGILKYDGERFNLLDNTDLFARNRIYTLLPFDNDKIIIGARNVGLNVYSPTENKILEEYQSEFAEVNEIFNENKIYCGVALKNGNSLLGTLTKGLIEINQKGEIIKEYNFNNGLQSNAIYSINYDQNGLLWCTLSKGITSINETLPFELYSILDGLNSTVFSIEHDGDVTFISTEQKSYQLLPDQSIKVISGTNGQNWYVKKAKDKTLFAHNPLGFLELTDKGVRPIKNGIGLVAVAITEIPNQPNLMLAGAHEGFYILSYQDDRWSLSNRVEGFDHAIYSFEMDHNKNIWVRCSPDDLYRLEINEKMTQIISSEKMNVQSSVLKDNGMLNPYLINNGQVIFGSNNGVFEYDDTEKRFKSFSIMSDLKGEVNPIMQDSRGNYWYEESRDGKHYKGVFKKTDSGWIHDNSTLLKFASNAIYKGPTKTITESPTGHIYFGTTKGVIVYDPNKEIEESSTFNTNIRNVHVDNKMIYAGHGIKNSSDMSIPHSFSDIRFQYAGQYYQDSEKIQYSNRLIGRDTTWSEWSINRLKEYTNLSDGSYEFQVKAQNIYNQESHITSYKFTILKPWYKSWWAKIGFLIGSALLFRTIIRINSSILLAKNEELERMVKSRTSELESEKEKSEHLSNNLLRMFSIIGHDLRKPAISFRGITSKINFFLEQKDYKNLEKLGSSIEKDAHSLMGLTDNLLNWALSQKNIMPYNPVEIHLVEIVHSVADIFKNLLSDKDIQLNINIPERHKVYADINAVQTIIRNLIDNAIKYTSTGGKITISSDDSENYVTLKIKDTGVGISQEAQKNLFVLDRQKSKKGTKGESGTGLGLYLVSELIALNKGSISVDNDIGSGASFNVSLPDNIMN